MSRLSVVLLAAYCGVLFFYGLNSGELYRTESLRAIIGAEFLRSGNWVVPTLYGQPLLTKPPGMYAAIALASWPFGGVTEWTARLPSALAATATVFLVYWYFSRQLGRVAGLIAAVIAPASPMWLDKSTAAEIDMLQVFWVTAAIVFFLRALEEQDKETRRQGDKESEGSPGLLVSLSPCLPVTAWWLASLLCVAGGVLTKWTAPAFFYGMAVPLLWWRGRLRLLWGRGHLLGVAVAASICLAWAVTAASLAGWDVLHETVSREALQRLSPSHYQAAREFMSPEHQSKGYPWGEVLLHPVKVLALNLPWSAFALLTLRPRFWRRWDDRGKGLLLALHCWVWPNLLFWSVIPEHALRHSFPLFPGIAGLAAMVWIGWIREGVGRAARGGPSTQYSVLSTQYSVLGTHESLPAISHARRFTPHITGSRPARILASLLVAWLITKVVFVEVVTTKRNPNRAPRSKGEQLAAQVPQGETLYLFRLKDEGIMFYYGGGVRRLNSPAELPSSTEPLYCILNESEWKSWEPSRQADVVLQLQDEQGAPIVLVKVGRHPTNLARAS